MIVSFEEWKNNWLDFGRCIDGEISIKQTPSIGLDIDFFYGSIEIKDRHNSILISQNVNKVDYKNASMSFLTFECNLKRNDELKLNLNRRDLFDRIFLSKRIKIGNDIFDKKFMISSSDSILARKIFSEIRCQDMFLSNQSLVFNISTMNDSVVLKIKYMQNRLYSLEEMQKALDDFNYILSFI
jgi:hypothetical protein